MRNVTIRFKFISNTVRETISCFEISVDENDYISKINLAKKLKHEWEQYSEKEFCLNKIIILNSDEDGNKSVAKLRGDEEIIVLYSEIVPPRSAANIDTYRTPKGDIMEFYIYPREQNHRFLPHICVKCKNETIRIKLTEEVSLLGKERFKGNNRKNETEAIEYVLKNKEVFLEYWHKFVEMQFVENR